MSNVKKVVKKFTGKTIRSKMHKNYKKRERVISVVRSLVRLQEDGMLENINTDISFWCFVFEPGSWLRFTLGGITAICFRFHFLQTLRMHTQGCQGCQKTKNFVRNSKILIARSTIQPKLSKIENNLPFFKEF